MKLWNHTQNCKQQCAVKKKLHPNFSTLNIIIAEKRKAAFLGKHNYSSIDKCYIKWQDIWRKTLQIFICVGIDQSIGRQLIFTILWYSTPKKNLFCSRHRSSCATEWSKEFWSRMLVIYTEKRKAI